MSHKTSHSQLTLRVGEELAKKINDLAIREGISRNKAALRLLHMGAGTGEMSHRRRIGSALDAFIGTWSDEQADELLSSIRSCDQVDLDFWK